MPPLSLSPTKGDRTKFDKEDVVGLFGKTKLSGRYAEALAVIWLTAGNWGPGPNIR